MFKKIWQCGLIKDTRLLNEHFGVNQWIRSKKRTNEDLFKYLEFRIKFIEEELDELKNSINEVETVDALIDIVVVALGTLDTFDIDIDKAWNEVFEANMNKEVGINPTRSNEDGLPDLVKPKGWKEPDHSDNIGLLGKIYE
jgi:hypothetical protein